MDSSETGRQFREMRKEIEHSTLGDIYQGEVFAFGISRSLYNMFLYCSLTAMVSDMFISQKIW